MNLSHTESFVLALVSALKENQGVPALSKALLGLYASTFLDDFEKSPHTLQNTVSEFFLNPETLWATDNSLIFTLNALHKSGIVEVTKKNLFNAFSLLKCEPGKRNTKLPSESNQMVIEIFNKNLFQFLDQYEHKHSKYEVRYFWPQDSVPEIYDWGSGLFECQDFKHVIDEDEYWINGTDLNIKLRNNELHVKECLQNINHIARFAKKKKVKLPLGTSLLNSKDYDSVVVIKERYVRKFDDKTKVEFSSIRLKGKKWKTICFEAKNFQTVLALSLLINAEGAERLTYTEFLNKHGRK